MNAFVPTYIQVFMCSTDSPQANTQLYGCSQIADTGLQEGHTQQLWGTLMNISDTGSSSSFGSAVKEGILSVSGTR